VEGGACPLPPAASVAIMTRMARSPFEEVRMHLPTRSLQWFLTTLLALAFASEEAKDGEKKAPGQKTGLIPRRILFGNPDRAQPKLSPDGKQLAFLAPVKGVLNVWVGPADKPDAAKPVTDDKKRGIRQYFWTYTNQHIVYLQDVGGDENWRAYSVEIATRKVTDLTPFKKVAAQINAVSHKAPHEILIGLNDRDERYHDLYRINITTGERKLLQKNDGYAGFETDDDYKVRFAMKFDAAGVLLLRPDGKGGWDKFLTIPQKDNLTTQPLGFTKDGNTLYLTDSRNRNTGALTTLDLKTGKQEVIAANPKVDVGQVLMHPTEKTVQGVAFTYTRTSWEFKDKAVAADFAVLKKVADGDLSLVSRTLDDQQWIVAFTLSDGPVRYYHYDRATRKSRFLFTNQAELAEWKLQKMYPVVIPTRDKLELVSYLTLPPDTDKAGKGRPDNPVPMVLLVHGGPWGRDSWGLNSMHQLLANRGYAVLSVNFRGSTGFGKAFVNAGDKEWAGKMHDDLIDAVNWAIKEKIAPKDKVAIMGGSYGGYATLVGMTFTPDVFACGVDIVGPSNILTLLNTIPKYWQPIVQLFKDRVGDYTTEEGKKLLLARSPLTRADRIKKPLLIGQGANDPRVKQAESDQIVKAMQEHKIPVTYVLFPDEGHGFARPENRLAFFAVTEAFLANNLGGRHEPIGDAFKGSSITVPAGVEHIPGLKDKLPGKQPEKGTK
jgi:dipeptidyl aminopeptidase/acylaminoacyl peptidase